MLSYIYHVNLNSFKFRRSSITRFIDKDQFIGRCKGESKTYFRSISLLIMLYVMQKWANTRNILSYPGNWTTQWLSRVTRKPMWVIHCILYEMHISQSLINNWSEFNFQYHSLRFGSSVLHMTCVVLQIVSIVSIL